MNKLQNKIIILIIILANIGADQITKYWARIYLAGQGYIEVIGKFFILTYAENSGAFLSLGSNLDQPLKTIVLVLFPSIVIIVATLYLILGKNISFKQSVAIACIIGGGIGNVYDRATHLGAVTDFLNFGFGSVLRTGILNVADLSITFGAIFLFIFQYQEEKKKEVEETDI